MNKTIYASLVAVMVVGGIAFYSGMKYGQSQIPVRGQGALVNGQFRNIDNLTGRTNRVGAEGANFITGEIINRDDKSITVKMRDGGSKIIFLSNSTVTSKTTDATSTDLEVGKQITGTGSTNSDGSLTAQMIQIRPTLPATPTSPTTK